MAEKRYLIRTADKVAVLDINALVHLIELVSVTKKSLERSKGRLQTVAVLLQEAVIEFGEGVEQLHAPFYGKVKEVRKLEPSFGKHDPWVDEFGVRIHAMQTAVRGGASEQKAQDSEIN